MAALTNALGHQRRQHCHAAGPGREPDLASGHGFGSLGGSGVLSGSGNLTIWEEGIVELDATNTCTGLITVSNGVLAVNGVVSNTINVLGGALSGTGTVNGPVGVGGTGQLTGTGTFAAPVQVNA